jgi:hypothetical protein
MKDYVLWSLGAIVFAGAISLPVHPISAQTKATATSVPVIPHEAVPNFFKNPPGIYLGPPASMTQVRLSPSLCADPAYMEMRLKRMSLVGQPTDGLKQYCASVAGR